MSTPIPEDLRELYESTAVWDGSLMVRFAQSHGVIPWAISADADLRRYLIERIAALEAQNRQLREALAHMIREWCEIVGDESVNSTPADTLEKARAALAATEKKA